MEFDHIMTKKTMQRASSDVGFMFIAYNLTRIWNIIRKTNTSAFKAYMTFLGFIVSILMGFKLVQEQNSKNKILV